MSQMIAANSGLLVSCCEPLLPTCWYTGHASVARGDGVLSHPTNWRLFEHALLVYAKKLVIIYA
ncbi:hypothetical protein KK120_05385 [Virgibacillus dakarensis]|nr:hypothetical protein [Virgibacillus dakarensis]